MSMADKKTMNSTRESPGLTSACCFASRLRLYVVATSAVSMRLLRWCYIQEGLVSVFYLCNSRVTVLYKGRGAEACVIAGWKT